MELLLGVPADARGVELLRGVLFEARGAGAVFLVLAARPAGTIRFRSVLGDALGLGRVGVLGVARGVDVVVRVRVGVADGRGVDADPGVRPEPHAGVFTIRSGAAELLSGVDPREGVRGAVRSVLPGVLSRRGSPRG